MELAQNFDKGIDTTLAQFRVFYPDIDVTGVDLDRIVVDGRIVDPPAKEDQENQKSSSGPEAD